MKTYYAHPAYASSIASSSIADAAKYCKVLEDKKNQHNNNENQHTAQGRELQNVA